MKLIGSFPGEGTTRKQIRYVIYLLLVGSILFGCASGTETGTGETYTQTDAPDPIWLEGDRWDAIPDVSMGTIVYSENLLNALEEYSDDTIVIATVIFRSMVSEEYLNMNYCTEKMYYYYDRIIQFRPEFEARNATILAPYPVCADSFMFHIEISKRELLSLTCKEDEAFYLAAVPLLK